MFIPDPYVFGNYLLSTYYVPGTIPGTGDPPVNETKMPAFWSLHSSERKRPGTRAYAEITSNVRG